MTASAVLFVNVPDVPVIVTVAVPEGAVALTERVSVLLLVAGFGANDAITPLGRPDAARVTLPVKAFAGTTVIVLVPLLPCTTPKVLGEDESVKDGGAVGVDPPQLLRMNARQPPEMHSRTSFSRSMRTVPFQLPTVAITTLAHLP